MPQFAMSVLVSTHRPLQQVRDEEQSRFDLQNASREPPSESAVPPSDTASSEQSAVTQGLGGAGESAEVPQALVRSTRASDAVLRTHRPARFRGFEVLPAKLTDRLYSTFCLAGSRNPRLPSSERIRRGHRGVSRSRNLDARWAL